PKERPLYALAISSIAAVFKASQPYRNASKKTSRFLKKETQRPTAYRYQKSNLPHQRSNPPRPYIPLPANQSTAQPDRGGCTSSLSALAKPGMNQEPSDPIAHLALDPKITKLILLAARTRRMDPSDYLAVLVDCDRRGIKPLWKLS